MGITKQMADRIYYLVNVKGMTTGEVARKYNIPERVVVAIVRRD